MVSAVVFYPQNTFFNKPSCVSFSKQLKLGYPIYSLKDGSLAFASQNGVLQSSDRKLPLSSNQEEIMALFRRIQYSISQGESTATGKKNAGRSEKSPTDSILEVLLRSRKQAKDTNTVTEGKNVPTHIRSVPKVQKMQAQNALADFKLNRPHSNFTKKFSIPSPSTPGEKNAELNNEASEAKASGSISELPRVEEMKLTELKELAKSRGIKGYSKLKKGQLLEFLRS